ncbi:hypothetical protein B2I21_16025 [Chryseobacterium mucoviscidosis]|nr:hypothetical protein B2I21_16025 [Chryseobacterium mucoviscidosis]
MKKIIIATMAGSILWSGCGANNHSSIPIKIDENASKESAATATPAKSTLNTLLSKTSDKRIAVYGVQFRFQ